MLRFVFIFMLLLTAPRVMLAQQDTVSERRLLAPEKVFFVPHTYLQLQGGAAYDVGEAYFRQLLSPSLQVALGRRFNEYVGLRATISGFWAKNRYAYPQASYGWRFLQPAFEFDLNLSSLFFGRNPTRKVQTSAFLGGGVAYSWGNDEAVEADNIYGVAFQKLWHDHRWNPVVRGGLGLDWFLTDHFALNAEVNANMLPDHFNSKRGRGDNLDWHFTMLVGVKFLLGRRYGRTEPVYETVMPPIPVIQPKADTVFVPLPVDTVRVEVPVDTAKVDAPVEKLSFNVNIYFSINRSNIRENQMLKLRRLVSYLERHPKAFVRLSGYADHGTGTPAINIRLSRERVEAVNRWLFDAGIDEARVKQFANGDVQQPFDVPSENRVCICNVYDPDNPGRIEDWY